MEATILEWVGYIASVTICISMAVSSIIKFRWINLLGALTFSIYGFLIGAIPVGILNGIVVLVDIYYLYIIYNKKEKFETIEIQNDSNYLSRFLEFHKKEINKYFPNFIYKPKENTISLFILRNAAVTGIFLAKKKDNNTLEVNLDYVIPEYRDLKNGKYIYSKLKSKFNDLGISNIITNGENNKHSKYLKNIGFVKSTNNTYIKKI
ncbi:MAG: hypothetical protein U9R54_03645 [Bacteroidota bacterium]|nr:hypothetical protein [Bacteroidota bacterium]